MNAATISRQSILLVALATFAGCHRNRPPASPPAPTATADNSAELARREAEEREAERRRAEEERLRGEREAAERARAAAEATLLAPVFFAYDGSDIDEVARQSLETKLRILQSNPALGIRVDGHTDERGSDEYNLALGQRRATAVKHFLVDRGIADGRIAVTSQGEERPGCSDSTEECWRRNRRAEFVVTAGTIAVPISSR